MKAVRDNHFGLPLLHPSPSEDPVCTPEALVVLTSGNRETGGTVHGCYDRERKLWNKWMTEDLGGGYGVAVVREVMAFIGGHREKALRSDVEIYHLEKKLWLKGQKMNIARYDQFSLWLFNITLFGTARTFYKLL